MFRRFFQKKVDPLEVGEFANRHRNLLVIVADPKDDTIFVTHKGKYVGGKLRATDGSCDHIIRDMLKESTFHMRIDHFLIGVAEKMGLKKLAFANNFLQFVDGAVFNLATKHRKKASTDSRAVKSPIQQSDVRSTGGQ